MTEVLQANIFFIIASVVTVVFGLIITLVLYQIYKIVRLIRSIVERLDSASEMVAGDAAELRQFLAKGGLMATLARLIMGTRKRRRTTEYDDDIE
jgi:hypothetical protein